MHITSIHVNTYVHRQLPIYSVHTQSFSNSARLSKSLKHQSKIPRTCQAPRMPNNPDYAYRLY